MTDDLREASLEYHRNPIPGKLEITATKPLTTQRDLALAYSPGVAAACDMIADDPGQAAELTARSNLVAVITNGTAVLGLGNIGPLASKPVMEGKAVLFKKFSGINVFDIEVDETDAHAFVETVARLEPTVGGINLEDIKAPECFVVERELRRRMKIPVFHDDQHGTAIIVAAAILNGLELVGKKLSEVRLVTAGAGAAALACLGLLEKLGLPLANITVTDLHGVVYTGRAEEMDEWKSRYARETDARKLGEVVNGADVFLGLSAPGVLSPEMVKSMADKPLILALANPTPEIMPELAREARPDAIIATGRSDYPNQVNNVLCFPYIFRGALDVGASAINDEMKLACVHALADLAKAETSDIVTKAYGKPSTGFGPDYLIPAPFDPRLVTRLPIAVARAAMKSGVATRQIDDIAAYRRKLIRIVYRSGTIMKTIFDRAQLRPGRLIYAEGEERRVLQATQEVVNERLAHPILIGRPEVIASRIDELGLSIRPSKDFELVNPQSDPRFRECWNLYHDLRGRRGQSPEHAKMVVRSNATVIAALLLKLGYADALLCGSVGRYHSHLRNVMSIIGKAPGVGDVSGVVALILPAGIFFICDTHVTPRPRAGEIAEMASLAAAEVRRFGIKPRIALLSHSNFGTRNTSSGKRMRKAMKILREQSPDLVVDGEMHADAALSQEIRDDVLPGSTLKGQANLLIMPNLDAAHITYNTLKMLGGGVTVGPILVGAAASAHIVNSSVTVRGLVNMSALAVAKANLQAPAAETNVGA